MRISAISIPLFFALFLPAGAASQVSMPLLRTADPSSAKVGDQVTLQGDNLGRDSVAAIYLSDGSKDVKVPILEQTATTIRFRIPVEVKPGRLAVLVLTREKEPRLIEEPVKITVEGET